MTDSQLDFLDDIDIKIKWKNYLDDINNKINNMWNFMIYNNFVKKKLLKLKMKIMN